MNPCPCGYYGDPRRACSCAPGAIGRYQKRESAGVKRGPTKLANRLMVLGRRRLEEAMDRLLDLQADARRLRWRFGRLCHGDRPPKEQARASLSSHSPAPAR